MGAEQVVVDASALVDLLVGAAPATALRVRLSGQIWHGPAHLDAEVLSALGRLHRAGQLRAGEVDERLALLGVMRLQRHALEPLLTGAWARRENLRFVDSLYVELAAQLNVPLVTTDRRLARATPLAEVVGA